MSEDALVGRALALVFAGPRSPVDALEGLAGADYVRQPAEARARADRGIAAARALAVGPAVEAMADRAQERDAGALSLGPDGLLARAGEFPLLELAGSLLRGRCAPCGFEPLPEPTGTCPVCSGLVRPDAVLSDEVISPRNRLAAEFVIGRAEAVVLVEVDPYPASELIVRLAEIHQKPMYIFRGSLDELDRRLPVVLGVSGR